MAKETINLGATANDGTGDPLRTAGQKINSNFTELYNTQSIDPVARTTANSAYATANTKFNSSGGTISGNVTIQGTLNVSDNTVVSKNVEANIIIVDTTLYSGLASRSSIALPNLIAQFASNSNTYIQVNAQNIDPQGSADYVITADNGSDTDYYIDMGMLGSQYNNQYAFNSLGTAGTPYDGYLYVQGSTIGQLGGNLIIGSTTTTPGHDIKFIVGGSNTNHIMMKVGSYGANVVGDLTVTGQTHAKVPGPYASDAAAASAGIKVGEMYYRSTGQVFVRLT